MVYTCQNQPKQPHNILCDKCWNKCTDVCNKCNTNIVYMEDTKNGFIIYDTCHKDGCYCDFSSNQIG